MHIILGLLGTIVTVLILAGRLKDSGLDLGWLNPFSWAHRRRWKKKYNADPAFMIKSPMEAAAGLMYIAAKSTGEMSLEEKSFILSAFQNSFNLTNRESTDLLSSCAYLLKDEQRIIKQVNDYLQPSLESFSESQKQSTLKLLSELSTLSGNPTEAQQELITKTAISFDLTNKPNENW